MEKKTIFLSGIAVAAVSVSRNSNESAVNDVTLANVEARANVTSSGILNCWNTIIDIIEKGTYSFFSKTLQF